MENNIVVYKHIRLDTNEVFYIGIGVKSRPKSKQNRNKYWHNIINKTNYSVEIIYEGLSWSEACEKEIELIKLYGRKDLGNGPLVNLTDGGDGVLGIKAWNKGITGIYKHSEETKKIMSKKRSGSNNSMFGKKHSEEVLNKMRAIKLGKKHTEETKNKMSINFKGRKHSEQTLKKMKETRNNKIYWTGKPIELIDDNNKVISEFISTQEAAKILNINRTGITAVLNGRQVTTKGYKFRFKVN